MEERAAVLSSCSSQAESDNSCLPLSVFLCGVCACVYTVDVCVHNGLHTHQMVVCLHVLVCVEYLFDLCHGLRLITSANRWL